MPNPLEPLGLQLSLALCTAGYWLGQIPWIERNFERVVVTIVFLSVLPLLIGVARTWWEARQTPKSVPETTEV